MTIRTTAPFRIDIGGGVTDIPQLGSHVGTAIVNIAIDLYEDVECLLPRSITAEALYGEDSTNHLYVNDTELLLEIGDGDEYAFVKAIFALFIRDIDQKRGTILKIFSTLPKGTGLGGSAVLSLCIFTSLYGLHNSHNENHVSDIVKMAHRFETTEIGIKGGFQDYVAACFGGCNYINFASLDAVDLTNSPNLGVRIVPAVEASLNESLLFVVQKENNVNSSTIVTDEIRCFLERREEMSKHLQVVKEINTRLYSSLKETHVSNSFWTTFGKNVSASWEAQKMLSPFVGAGRLSTIEESVRPYVYGLRGPGAGGNSLVLLVKPDKRKELMKILGMFKDEIILLYGRINNEGVRVIKYDEHA